MESKRDQTGVKVPVDSIQDLNLVIILSFSKLCILNYSNIILAESEEESDADGPYTAPSVYSDDEGDDENDEGQRGKKF